FSLRYEIAFSAIQKLKLFSLLKIKEDLKQATGIVRRVASHPATEFLLAHKAGEQKLSLLF
ncbi:MAG: hypothetical protein K2M50_09915, partial [Treponemataceae bacterium]|nr:hypothetical protein [Treponemataceae bacterium]